MTHVPFRVVIALAVPALFAAGPDELTHDAFRREAQAAHERKDYAAARAATLRALELRPDSPRYLYNAGAFSALLGEPEVALDYLRRLAALGVTMPAQRDPDFASLQGTPEFSRLVRALGANADPRGEAEVVAELPGRTGILEGIAFHDRTGDVFLGDVHHRCVWRRDRSGELTRFTAEDDELLGIFGLTLDERRNTLWAAMAAVPEMAGFEPAMKGRAALAEFDLAKGDLRRVIGVPVDGRDHLLGDVLLASNGTVFATDSSAPVVWKLEPDDLEFQKVIDSPEFGSLQGLALNGRTLLVADHVNGLFTIDLGSGRVRALQAPKDVTLLGIDGLVRAGDFLFAVQNGVTPQRVLRIRLSPAWDSVSEVTVLASGLPDFHDLALITLVQGRATVIAGAGWDRFDPTKRKEPPAHTVRLFQVATP